jgi:hypothetical protein
LSGTDSLQTIDGFIKAAPPLGGFFIARMSMNAFNRSFPTNLLFTLQTAGLKLAIGSLKLAK